LARAGPKRLSPRPGDEEPGAVSLEKNAAPGLRVYPHVVAVVQLVEPRGWSPEDIGSRPIRHLCIASIDHLTLRP
jgi:hypothetical protein